MFGQHKLIYLYSVGDGHYIAVVGDLARSREATDRAELAERVGQVLSDLNERFASQLYAPLALTRGIDELSAVLSSPACSYRMCAAANDALHPQFFRFAVCRGVLDVNVSSRDASTMDGPAFHEAADLLAQTKRQDLVYTFQLGFSSSTVRELVNSLANLVAGLKLRRTEHQQKVARNYAELGSQEAVSGRMGISQQAVSDALKSARWAEIRGAETVIDHAMSDASLYADPGIERATEHRP